MENYLENELGKTGISVETLGSLIILNLSEEVFLRDLVSLWSITAGIKSKSPEWQFLLNPDQLILDFTKVYYIDQLSNEFVELANEYKKAKGKGIIFCGLGEKVENLLRIMGGEEFDKVRRTDTRENALKYYYERNS